jgi:hypothetical protein
MPIKTVFISSTFKDLQKHRRAVWDALRDFDVVVRGMEDFGARATSPLETCLAEVEQSDVYVGIIAYRLGSIEPKSKKPFTLLEYEKAVEKSEEILIYLADDDASIFPVSSQDEDPEAWRTLDVFKRKLKDLHTVNTFSTPEDLAEKLTRDFHKRFNERQPSPSADAADEYLESERLISRFFLMPKRLNGTEVRLSVRFLNSFFPASRLLCQEFNLEYGAAIGAYIELLKPNSGGSERFNEIFCPGSKYEVLMDLAKNKEAELYAELLFTGKDVPLTRGEFFGYSGMSIPAVGTLTSFGQGGLYGNPVYVPADGKVILLFSKPVS